MKSLLSCFLPAALALASTACGSLSSGDEGDALATLEGRLGNAQAIEVPSALRVAVVWSSASARGGFTVAQDIEVEPVFPSSFRLALRSVPPEAAMVDSSTQNSGNGADDSTPGYNPDDPNAPGDSGNGPPTGGGIEPQDIDIDLEPPPGVRVAVGTLVAYEDTNGNGKLDLVDEAATQFVDRVIGANPELMLLYMEGDPAVWAGSGDASQRPQRGYQLLRLGRCESVGQSTECTDPSDPSCGKPEAGPACEESVTLLPASAPFELPISNDPQLSATMCRSQSSPPISSAGGRYPGQIPETDPGPAGYPPASEVTCDADGRAYAASACIETDHGPCRGVSSQCELLYIGLPQGAVPAGWPCTVEP